MYFIYGEEQYLIDRKIQEIISKAPNSKVLFLDKNVSLNDAINEISTISIFESRKVVIFKNLHLLTKSQPKEIKSLISSLKSIPSSNEIVFVLEQNIPKGINPLINFLNENSKQIECNKLKEKELNLFAKEYIKARGGSISEVNLFYFLSKVPNKLIIVINELEKLLLIDPTITKENIDKSVPKYETINAFDFINSFSEQNTDLIFKYYYDSINSGESIGNLINQISSTLDLTNSIHSYKMLGKSNAQIAEELGKHIFVIQKNEKLLTLVGYSKIKQYIKDLSTLDTNIKTGKINEKIGFELFLLNLIK